MKKLAVAGFLSTIGGISMLVVSLGYIALIVVVTRPFTSFNPGPSPPFIETAAFLALGVVGVASSMVAIVGGNQAPKARRWGWVVAGAICAVPVVLGMVALALVLMAKKEFREGTADEVPITKIQ